MFGLIMSLIKNNKVDPKEKSWPELSEMTKICGFFEKIDFFPFSKNVSKWLFFNNCPRFV